MSNTNPTPPPDDVPLDWDKFKELADETEEAWEKTYKPMWEAMTKGFDWSAETNP